MRPDQFLDRYSPEKIHRKLEEAVIGQDAAKRAVVSAVWWNLYRATLLAAGEDPKLLPAKLNVLLLGPSGIGKTELAKATAAAFNVPWVTTSAPNYSSAGYTGADVDDMLGLLLQAAGGESESAERGIVVLDEVDKLRRRDFGGQSDVGCEAIQQAMLSLLEGCEAMPRSRGGERVKMRSHFVTFVGTGAFIGLNAAPGTVPASALVSEGFIPEFIARWSMRIRLQDVDREMLRKIIHSKRSALARMTHLFKIHGIELIAEEKAIDSLIDQAMEDGVGARGLNETLWSRLNSLVAEIPQMLQAGVGRVVIDPAAMQGLPAWKLAGESDTLSPSAAALLHPVKANEKVKNDGWSPAELTERLEYLAGRLDIAKCDAETRNAWWSYLRNSAGKTDHEFGIRLSEELAFEFSPPCSIAEFSSALQEAECHNSAGVLALVRYRRAVAAEQKSARPRNPRRRPPEPPTS